MEEKDFILADALRSINDMEGYTNIEKHLKQKPHRHKIFYVFLIDTGFRALYLYRKRHNHKLANHRVRYLCWKILDHLLNKNISIDENAIIGPGVLLKHANGVVIGPAKIGASVTIYQHVTIGGNFKAGTSGEEFPTIENNVIIAPGAVVAGPIRVGPNTLIGANVVLTKSFEGNGVVGGARPEVRGKYDRTRFG